MRFHSIALAGLLPIAPVVVAADYLTLEAAQHSVFPHADSFQELLMSLTPEQQQAVAALAGPQPPHGVIRVWKATQGGTLAGWVFMDEVVGRQDLITYVIGVDASGTLCNMEIMSYRESHGGEIRNPGWRRQFDHRSDLSNLRFRSDIKNISGSTLSSEHVTQGVRWLLAVWQQKVRSTT